MMLRAVSAAALLAAAAPALAQGAAQSAPVELLAQPGELKAGQWVWAPEMAPHGPLLVYVDLTRQLATVYRNGVRMAVTTISSGKPGHDTPTGVFTILQKDANHHSSKYNDAPMPYQERLTWDGVALHAGGLPDAGPRLGNCPRYLTLLIRSEREVVDETRLSVRSPA